ncbi:hypothetical protein ACSBR2_011457 [Camellia fascicularis]
MGKFRSLVDTPEAMAMFRRDYGIPDSVTLSLAKVDAKRMGSRSTVVFPVAAIVERGVRFPFDPLVRRFLHQVQLTPIQDHSTYYLHVCSVDCHLVTGLPDSDKHNDNFLQVGGNWEFPAMTEFQSERMSQKDGYPEASRFQRRLNRGNTEAIKAVLRYEKRSAPELLDYQATYRSTIPKKARLASLLDFDTETDTSLTPLVTNHRRSQGLFSERTPSPVPSFAGGGSMSKRRVLVDLEVEAFGSSDALGTPLVEVEAKSFMDVKLEIGASGPYAAAVEPSALVAARAKKRRRKTGKAVVGEASEDPIGDESFEKWEPPMLYQGRPISTLDSVIASGDFAFDLTKTLLMPVDMADHNGPRDIPVLKGTLQIMTACIQRMHLLIIRGEELEKAVLKAAMNAERLSVSLEAEKEGRRTAEREVFRLSKVVTSIEKSKEAAIGV